MQREHQTHMHNDLGLEARTQRPRRVFGEQVMQQPGDFEAEGDTEELGEIEGELLGDTEAEGEAPVITTTAPLAFVNLN